MAGVGKVGKGSEDGESADDDDPKLAFFGGLFLGIDAGDGGCEDDEPDTEEANPDLVVEFGGMEAEAIKNFNHRWKRGEIMGLKNNC